MGFTRDPATRSCLLALCVFIFRLFDSLNYDANAKHTQRSRVSSIINEDRLEILNIVILAPSLQSRKTNLA